jgi:hypothetical protein
LFARTGPAKTRLESSNPSRIISKSEDDQGKVSKSGIPRSIFITLHCKLERYSTFQPEFVILREEKFTDFHFGHRNLEQNPEFLVGITSETLSPISSIFLNSFIRIENATIANIAHLSVKAGIMNTKERIRNSLKNVH